MTKEELQKIADESEGWVWITHEAGFNNKEDGEVYFTEYHRCSNGGGLIRRDSMDADEPHSVAWLKQQKKNILEVMP